MLFKKLIDVYRTDAELPAEIRAALIDSLFVPIASLIAGALACSIIGAVVALRAENNWIMADSVALFVIGTVRVVSAVHYRRQKSDRSLTVTTLWERLYESGAWAFATLLGLLCWLTITPSIDASLQMAVTTTSAGYAAAISGRNAARPVIAIGQLMLCTLPMILALLAYPDRIHNVLGLVVLMFIYGMIEITLGIRDTIIQALIMTRKEASLAARLSEQASRFDIALNNMSHGLCMLDQQGRLQVWNEQFLELLNLKSTPVAIGMRVSQLVRHSIRAGNHTIGYVKSLFNDFSFGQQNGANRVHISPGGKRIIEMSRRVMTDGGSVIILEDVTERERAQERIATLAKYDDLTGLTNRTQFRERIEGMLAALRNSESGFAILIIDLDRFKSINDSLGHPIGDKLLKEVSLRLHDVISLSDMISRLGGDEFTILQSGANRYPAGRLAQKIIEILRHPFEIEGQRIDIGASIGIALAPDDSTDPDELLKRADMALYAAKGAGGSAYRFFAQEMELAIQTRRALELDMRQALELRQFKLYYQPLVNLRTGQVTSCEALLRWFHSERGEILPSTFIPVAEETGLIVSLGRWVLEQSCADATTWPGKVKVAVNLSAVQFREPSLTLHVTSALTKSNLEAERLEVELTERVLLEESSCTLTTIRQLKRMGVNISLDDFGTGYSSLNYLHKFPFHKIKIDQSFIRDISSGNDGWPIVGAVAHLGAGLNKIVVAEGVENEQQLHLVKEYGCHEGQGFYFSRPMSGDAIRVWLQTRRANTQLVA